MKFFPITISGLIGGDETRPYHVTDFRAKTIVEFINEVLETMPKEWGYFRVKGSIFLVEYRYGEMLSDIPDEWEYREIDKVESSGGWSRMDYTIYPKN